MPLQSSTDAPISDLLVMFGASGDLAKKKLFPAIYRLECRGRLGIPVIGVAREAWTDDDLRSHCRDAIAEAGEEWDQAAFDQGGEISIGADAQRFEQRLEFVKASNK